MCKTKLGRGIWSAISGLCWICFFMGAGRVEASIPAGLALEAGLLLAAAAGMRKAGWYIGQRDWRDR